MERAEELTLVDATLNKTSPPVGQVDSEVFKGLLNLLAVTVTQFHQVTIFIYLGGKCADNNFVWIVLGGGGLMLFTAPWRPNPQSSLNKETGQIGSTVWILQSSEELLPSQWSLDCLHLL